MGLLNDIEALRTRQIATIDKVRDNYAALKDVESKEFDINGMKVRAVFNPARAISSAAKVDAATISARPCFLCQSNRLEGQESVECLDGRYEVLINPFPIFERHFVIAGKRHERQSFAGRLGDMFNLARELKGYTVFYNGPRCGASAPDHMHFQAILSQELPLWEAIALKEPAEGIAIKAGGVPADIWIIDAATAGEADIAMARLLSALPQGEQDEWEPRVNLLATATDKGVRFAIIARPQHRPSFYTSDPADENGMIISPASVDVAGVFVMPRRMDFDRLTADIILKVYNETCRSRLKEEPIVKVGILTAPEINVKFIGHGRVKFEIADVTIGKDFHWERRQCQRFGGRLEMRRNNDGSLTAINHIGVEDYLTSVIGSEMNRESPIELLKAHAVISRSWLIAQIRKDLRYPGIATTDAEDRMDREDVTVDWQDREDHVDFDVCADDHCQRYQGIGDGDIADNVDEAMAYTRGEVLTYEGMICDTRFSKCCGGKTEDFASCWEPHHHPYLTPVDDPYCAEATPQLLARSLNGYDMEDRDTYRWRVRYTAGQLEKLLKRRSGIDFGEIQELNALKRGASGRIYMLEIVGSKARKTIGKELTIRRWLSKTHLKSSAFEATRLPGGGWQLDGHGWGHGVGLCQIGAAVMADKGMTYREILSHYYPGSTIEKLY